jgi:hypothetical protein
MKTTLFLAGSILCGGLSESAVLPLTESTFTEIIQEANVVAASNKAVSPAKTNELFRVPDLVRTGQASRAELTAKDQTITRVGANTTFTFAQAGREIQLEKGEVLLHSPAGAGGGTIKAHGTSAAVLGTTLIGCLLDDGSFKVIDLEGSVKVTLHNGLKVILKPGQFVLVSADGTQIGGVQNFNLGEFASHSLLVEGFTGELSSRALIEEAVQLQNQQIAAGSLGTLVAIDIVGSGLDMSPNALKGWTLYTDFADSAWNPLDMPGDGKSGPGGYQQLPPGLPPGNFSGVTSPPVITRTNFIHRP